MHSQSPTVPSSSLSNAEAPAELTNQDRTASHSADLGCRPASLGLGVRLLFPHGDTRSKVLGGKEVQDGPRRNTDYDLQAAGIQEDVEAKVVEVYHRLRDSDIGESVYLMRHKHLAYLRQGIRHLPSAFSTLDASQPWLCYWCLHSMSLLGASIPPDLASDVIDFLSRCQAPTGGFGGGPGQLPHLAPTYASVMALCTIGTEEAFNAINRPNLQKFLLSLHLDSGGFTMHEDGELDIRGAYCALAVATVTNIMIPELYENTGEWLASCQTYEGGFSAVPGTEAHGGYTFCGFAAALLLKKHHLCDLPSLLRWVSRRQMKVEGGFQGRTNKLVDGCYSFWQGGVFPLIYIVLKEQGDKALHEELWHFNQEALQEYILYCCQHPKGGLLDKPTVSPDYYHTCYCLSGLSVAQHCHGNERVVDITHEPDSILKPLYPPLNITMEKAQVALAHFSKLPPPKIVHCETGDHSSP